MKKRHNSIITVAMMLIAMAPAAFGQYNDEYMAAPPLNEDFYIEDSTSADSNWNGGSVTTGYQTYTIKKGDTLGSISKKFFGTTTKWKLIAETNNISNPGAIKIGQVLEIPATKLERGQGTLMRQQPQNDYQSSMYSNQNYNGNSYNPSLGYPTYQEPVYQPISAYGGGTIGSSYDAMPTAPSPDNSVTNLPLPPVTSNDDAVVYSDAGLPQIILPGSGDNSRFRLKSEERYDVSFSGLTGLVNTYSAFTLGENKFSTAIGFMWNSIEKREGNRLVAGEEGDFYRFPFILTYSGENFEVAFVLPVESYDVFAPVTYNFRDGTDSGIGDCELRFKFSSQTDEMATCIGLGAFFPTSDIDIGNAETDNAWEIFGGISSKRKEGGNIHLNGGYRGSSKDNTEHEGVFINVGFDYKANESFTFIGEINHFDGTNNGKSTDLTLGMRYFVKDGMSVTFAAPISLSNDMFFGYDYRLQGMLQYHY